MAVHECPECGYICDCDGEDIENPPPADCRCALNNCGGENDPTYDDAGEDEG